MRREQRHLGLGAGRHLVGQRIDAQKAVGLREGRDRAGALAGRDRRSSPSGAFDQRHHDEFGAAELGGDPHRHRRALTLASERGGRPAIRRSTGTIMSWKVNIAEVGNPGRMTTGLPSQTARHSGLPGFSATPWAMMPGLPSRRDDAMRHIARALRGAARQHQHVAGLQAPAASRLRAAPRRRDMAPRTPASPPFSAIAARDDRAVGVVDRGRAQRLAGLHQFVAGREDGDARPARDGDLRDAAGRQHADLARADDGAGAQQRLAAGDVGAGIGRRIVRATRRGGFRSRVGAATAGCARPSRRRRRRAAPARRSRSASPCPTAPAARRDAAGDHLVVEQQAHRRASPPALARSAERTAKPSTLERSNGGTSIGATTSSASDAAERVGERHGFAPERPRQQRRLEARHRVLARQHGQELLLGDGGEEGA